MKSLEQIISKVMSDNVNVSEASPDDSITPAKWKILEMNLAVHSLSKNLILWTMQARMKQDSLQPGSLDHMDP